jgi:hypothetical protein
MAAEFITDFRNRYDLGLLYSSLTRSLLRGFSATGLTGVTTATLPFTYFSKIIAEDKIKLSMQRHGDGHIGEESFQRRHFFYLFSGFYITTLPPI